MIKFLNYFQRVNEVKRIKENNLKLIATLSGVKFIDQDDKESITKLLDMLSNPKKRYFVQPLETKGSDIPWVRTVQDTIAKYLGKVSSEEEMVFLQQLFKASEDFFRYQEMFEQNMLFMMFMVAIIATIVTPLIIVYV